MNYRKSDYCIDVKLESAEGRYMLLHSYTGALDVVSDELVKYLKSNKQINKEDFPFSETTFDQLVKRGYLTQKTTDEERELVRRIAELLHKNAKNSPKLYGFMVSYDCNFRCAYCFEGGISKNGKQWSKKMFTKEMVDRAYEAMSELEPDEKKRSKRIILYGGEPFLKENVNIVEYIVDKGIALGYDFEAITNGHDLDHYKSVLSKKAIKKLQITLDGTREMHNSRRYHFQTGDSFDVIFKNIQLALDNNVKVGVRFNADAKNFEEAQKLQKLFDDAGYSENKNFGFYTALLRSYDTNIDEKGSLMNTKQQRNDDRVNDKNIAYLNREEFNTMQARLGASHDDCGLYKKLTDAIYNGKYLRLNSTFCGVQSNVYIFDPYGNLYSCFEAVGIKSHISGVYHRGIEFSEERIKWHDRNIGNKIKCSVCKYGLLCGGGCLAKTLRMEDNFDKSYCDNYGDTLKRSVNMVFNSWQNNTTDVQ